MQKSLLLLTIIALAGISANYAYSQEMGFATFQEVAQVIVDKSISQNVTASITLQSTSVQEIKIPVELEQKIRENRKISAVILTNQNQCVLGVENQACILINVKRDPADKTFPKIQNSTLRVANQFIDDINQMFDTDAKLHSTFIHSDDQSNEALETSGVVSGRGTVSAVYTMPLEDTSSMYEKISAILIPKIIRDAGGFYETAKNLSSQDNAKMTFSIIPTENVSLMQLRVTATYPNIASSVNDINPLELLQTKELTRSDYFSAGFYPLNSLLQVVVLSPESTKISDVRGTIVETQIVDNEKIPVDITKKGWVFDPEEGERIQGKYIFGKEFSVGEEELRFALGGEQINYVKPEINFDESIIVVIIITIVAIAAALFYLKGYKK